jgi:hypothetical protein
MAKESKTIVGNRRSFVQARRRALTRIRDGMELRWTPARSRDEHRRFGNDSFDSSGAQGFPDAIPPDATMGDERE